MLTCTLLMYHCQVFILLCRHFAALKPFVRHSLLLNSLSLRFEMNNFRFEQFVSWHQLDFVSTPQESVPLCTPESTLVEKIISMFGVDFERYMTFTEIGLVNKLSTLPCNIACPTSQLSQSTEKLTDFVLWIALPETRLLNFISTGVLYMADFPHMGSKEDNLRLNFSLSARSALLFLAFSQSLSRMHGGHFDAESGIVLLSFKIGTGKLYKALGNGTMGLWNRKYLDYFLNVKDYLTLDIQEIETLKAFTFHPYTIETFVNQMNEELDEWNGPQNQKTFHWRHYHLALNELSIVNALLGLESSMEASVETLYTLTKTFSQQSFEVISVGEPEPTLEEWADAEPKDFHPIEKAYESMDDPVVLCTMYGQKYHFYDDCHGLNNKETKTFPLSKVESCRSLCAICEARRMKMDFVTQNFVAASSSSSKD